MNLQEQETVCLGQSYQKYILPPLSKEDSLSFSVAIILVQFDSCPPTEKTGYDI
jgi:hypothetical protein